MTDEVEFDCMGCGVHVRTFVWTNYRTIPPTRAIPTRCHGCSTGELKQLRDLRPGDVLSTDNSRAVCFRPRIRVPAWRSPNEDGADDIIKTIRMGKLINRSVFAAQKAMEERFWRHVSERGSFFDKPIAR